MTAQFVRINNQMVNLNHIVLVGKDATNEDSVLVRTTYLKTPIVLAGAEGRRVLEHIEALMPWEPPAGRW
jgi:hypothetical protein